MGFSTRFKNAAKVLLGRAAVQGEQLAPLSQSMTLRTIYFQECLKRVSNVPGAIVECGVGQGYGLCLWLTLTALEPEQRMIWAFNSFEGFPEFSKEDQLGAEQVAGFSPYKQFNLLYVFNLLKSFGAAPAEINRRISFAKGFIPDSLGLYDKGPISLLHLDLDIFKSYKNALNFFWDYVTPGGIVMFDEYNKALDIFKFPGAQKAINEFLDAHNLRSALRKDPSYGNVYIRKPL